MVEFSIQILHTKEIFNELVQGLKSAFEDFYIELEVEVVSSYFRPIYSTYSFSGKALSGYRISFPSLENTEQNIELISTFQSYLKDINGVVNGYKYYDSELYSQNKQVEEDLFKIEMAVREIISFMFSFKSDESYKYLLSNFDLKLQSPPSESELRDKHENELFYLLFSDYKKLNELKPLTVIELNNYIVESVDFDSMRNEIRSRGITQTEHRDYLLALGDKLSSIENVRNCIAHNRVIPTRALENFKNVKSDIFDMLSDFWRTRIVEPLWVSKSKEILETCFTGIAINHPDPDDISIISPNNGPMIINSYEELINFLSFEIDLFLNESKIITVNIPEVSYNSIIQNFLLRYKDILIQLSWYPK